jgi:hypothetical protein
MKDEVDQSQFYFITKVDKLDDKDTLLYDQFEYVSTRTFDNIFFEQKEDLRRRLDFFLKNESWYQVGFVLFCFVCLFVCLFVVVVVFANISN